MRKLMWSACLVAAVAVAGVAGSVMTGPSRLTAADGTAPAAAAKGQLTADSLGTMLTAIGLKAERSESRYDFQFSSKIGEEWNLSMSAVLSNDGQAIWMMAWLDECPKNAADVPRQALLRLLADNDSLGGGKFFAFIASNRRFVLQRVMENRDITSASFRASLTDLAKTVVETYPHWNTGAWKTLSAPASGSDAGNAQQAGTDGKPAATAAKLPAANSTQKK
jgi:hypothetical protein